MLTIVFFASIREQLGVDSLEQPLSEDNNSLSKLKQSLVAQHSDWQSVLMAENVITAVNHDVVKTDITLNTGDEVAFFPPVTGG